MNLPLPGGENHKITCISRFRIKQVSTKYLGNVKGVCVSRVKCVWVFFRGVVVFFCCAPPSQSSIHSSIHPSIPSGLHHTLSNQKKKKMATNRKRESCQLLLPLLRLPLPWWSPAYWSDGEGDGSGWEKVITPVSQGMDCFNLYSNYVAWRQQLCLDGAF